jgi:hypothetical protein
MAMQHISQEVKGFKKYCVSNKYFVSNAMDETDNDMLWNGNEEDGCVRCECEEDEGSDCEYGDSDTYW